MSYEYDTIEFCGLLVDAEVDPIDLDFSYTALRIQDRDAVIARFDADGDEGLAEMSDPDIVRHLDEEWSAVIEGQIESIWEDSRWS